MPGGSCFWRRARSSQQGSNRIHLFALRNSKEILVSVLVAILVGNGATESQRVGEWSRGWGMHAKQGLLRPVGHGLSVELPIARGRPMKQQSLSARPHNSEPVAGDGASMKHANEFHVDSSDKSERTTSEHEHAVSHTGVARRSHVSSLKISPERDESWIVPALSRVMEDDEARNFHISDRPGESSRLSSDASKPVVEEPVHQQAVRAAVSASTDRSNGASAPVRDQQKRSGTASRGRHAAHVQHHHHHAAPLTTAEVHHKLRHAVKPMIQLPADDNATEAAADQSPAEAEEAGAEDREDDEERDIEDGVREAFDFEKIKYADIPLHYWAWWLAVVFVVLTIAISGNLILRHLENYEQPEVQKYVVRILFMAPLYAVDALLCLTFDGVSPFLNVVRDCYEAFTLYSFTKMLYVWLGGEREVIRMMAQKKQIQLPFPFHAMEPWAMGDEMFYNCKLGVIQYVFIIPFLAVATFVCAAAGVYEGEQWYTLDMWISAIACISATYAIYCLITFYLSMQEELEASVSNALAKFLCVKAVVFFCFWQELVLQLILMIGAMPETEQFSSRHLVGAIQEWLICFEMFIIAICFTLAYPVEEIIEMKTLNTGGDAKYGTFKEDQPNVV